MSLVELIPKDWAVLLQDEIAQPYFSALSTFVDRERRAEAVFPAARDTFAALAETPFRRVRVVLLGQDPYHGEGQANGLCFSVRDEVRPPPSLVNIFKEMERDVGCARPSNGDLTAWARRDVLLLNTVLTVRAGQPHSHRNRGWERFTDAVIDRVNARPEPVVFVLWGRPAQQKRARIDESRHAVVTAAHPSPLSARNGFFGSRPFSRVNTALKSAGRQPIDWCLR